MYHLDLVQCQGDENLLISCSHRRIYNNYYYCHENAEVMCNSKFLYVSYHYNNYINNSRPGM